MSVEGAGGCHCEPILNYLWKIMVIGKGFLRTGRKQTSLLSLRLDSKEITDWSASPHYLRAWQNRRQFTPRCISPWWTSWGYCWSISPPCWSPPEWHTTLCCISNSSAQFYILWQLPEGTLHPIILVCNEEMKFYLFSCDPWGTPLVTVLQLNLMLHEFMKGKLSLTCLIALYKEMTGSVMRGEYWILFISSILRLLALL